MHNSQSDSHNIIGRVGVRPPSHSTGRSMFIYIYTIVRLDYYACVKFTEELQNRVNWIYKKVCIYIAGRSREQDRECRESPVRDLTCGLEIDNEGGNASLILTLPLQLAAFLYVYLRKLEFQLS